MTSGTTGSRVADTSARALGFGRRRLLGGGAVLLLLAAAPKAWSEAPRAVAVSLVDGKASGPALTGGSSRAPTLLVRQGEAVELRWSSDREVALHLHGYGLEAHAAPGRDGVMSFVARAAGRFPVETHDGQGRHRAIAYIEVHPR